jgi:septum formation protein
MKRVFNFAAGPATLAQSVLEQVRDSGRRHAETVESLVYMRPANGEEVARYAATGEGLDKAGAYAVQGCGAFLIERIEGSYSNVIGLPACEVVQALQQSGVLPAFPMPA